MIRAGPDAELGERIDHVGHSSNAVSDSVDADAVIRKVAVLIKASDVSERFVCSCLRWKHVRQGLYRTLGRAGGLGTKMLCNALEITEAT